MFLRKAHVLVWAERSLPRDKPYPVLSPFWPIPVILGLIPVTTVRTWPDLAGQPSPDSRVLFWKGTPGG
jgi:hypothetical protein